MWNSGINLYKNPNIYNISLCIFNPHYASLIYHVQHIPQCIFKFGYLFTQHYQVFINKCTTSCCPISTSWGYHKGVKLETMSTTKLQQTKTMQLAGKWNLWCCATIHPGNTQCSTNMLILYASQISFSCQLHCFWCPQHSTSISFIQISTTFFMHRSKYVNFAS